MIVHLGLKMSPGLWARLVTAARRHGLLVDQYASEVLEVHCAGLPPAPAGAEWPVRRWCRCCQQIQRRAHERVRALLRAWRAERARRQGAGRRR